jgi:hypothetical protein
VSRTASGSTTPALTTFRGRVGDHNDLGMAGTGVIGTELRLRLGVDSGEIGTPGPALSLNWDAELTAAPPSLREMARRYEDVYSPRQVPITAPPR